MMRKRRRARKIEGEYMFKLGVQSERLYRVFRSACPIVEVIVHTFVLLSLPIFLPLPLFLPRPFLLSITEHITVTENRRMIYVTNVSPLIMSDDLYRYFAKCGTIKAVRMSADEEKGAAVSKYGHRESVAKRDEKSS